MYLHLNIPSLLCLPPQSQEGDRLRAADYVTGSVEVRQLRSVYKLSFTDIVRVNRFKPAEMEEMGGPTDEESDESLAARRRAEGEQNASVRLYVFLTKKKAKTRMADLEETAFLLRLDVGKEGCICFGKSFGNFDQVCTGVRGHARGWGRPNIPPPSTSSPMHGVGDCLRTLLPGLVVLGLICAEELSFYAGT